jgi:hypothetical protein
LRVVSGLSVGVEVDLIDASLSQRAWLGVPSVGAQLDLAEFLHGKAAPNAPSFRRPRQTAIATPSKLIDERVQLARFSAQHMGTKQSGKAVIDSRNWLPASSRNTEQFISRADRFQFGNLSWHTSSEYDY